MIRRLRDRAMASGDAHWLYRANGRLATIARAQGEFAEGLTQAEEARQHAASLGRPIALYEAMMGECLYWLGRTAEAIEAFERSYASATREGNDFQRAQSLGWLSDQHNELGNHTAAVDYGLQALEIARKGDLGEIAADQQINLAFAWIALGQGRRALDAVGAAQNMIRAPMAQTWHTRIHNDSASLYFQLGLTAEALAAINRSLAIPTIEPLRRAEAYLLRAEIRLELKRHTEATQDLAAAAELFGDVPSYRARARLTAGQLAMANTDFAAAATAFAAARDAAAGFPALRVKAHVGLSNVHARQGQIAESLAESLRAIDLVEGMRRLLVSEHRAGFLASRIPLYRDSAQLLLRLNRIPEAFLMAERGRARALLDLTESQTAPMRGESPELTRLRAAMASAKQARRLADRRAADLELQAATDRYLIAMGGGGQTSAPLTLAQIQAGIRPGEVLLHYTLGEPQSSLFAVTRERVRHFPLGSRATLEAAVRPARALLSSPPERLTQGQLLDHLQRLYRTLIAPAAAELRGERELTIVADGVLHTLPFEALVEGGTGDLAGSRFLVRRFTVRYAPSATLAARETGAIGSPFLLAYGDARGEGTFERLPFSREEVERVAALYPANQRRVALQQAANESALKQEPALATSGILHLAVHGFLDDRWPLMSGLVLPQAPGESTEDGVLRIYEILALRLKAQLVVLSACDSGSGTDVTGEGLSSLRRAFLAAGAHSIVASLWRVNDRAAAELMIAFHRQLRQKPPAEALRAAQLHMLASGRTHPYYWSVFTLMSGAQER